MQAKAYTSEPIGIEASPSSEDFARAAIEFHGLDHSGASFEGRVFVNNPEANERTELTVENGYVGSFFIFGHGGCYGDVGHCEVSGEQRAYDPRQSHPLTPEIKAVRATQALQQAVTKGEEIRVTVVPVIASGVEKPDTDDVEDVLKFDHLSITTYR